MTNVRTPTINNAPALSVREDDRELRKLIRDTLRRPTPSKPKTEDDAQRRRRLARKLFEMREGSRE